MTELATRPVPYGHVELDPDHFDQHRDVYRDIFSTLGAEPEDTDTLERAVEVSQVWIRGDYGQDDGLPRDLDDLEKARLREWCVDGLGMGPSRELPPGHYDKLLLFGASQFGNVRRSEAMAGLLASPAHTFGRVVLLGGERPLYQKEVAGFRRLLDDETIVAKAADDEWLATVRSDFYRHLPEGTDTSQVDPSVYALFGETTQMRVSLLKALGSVALTSERLEVSGATRQPVGVQEFELSVAEGVETVRATLLHCPPRERKNGPPRHTTESCVGNVVDVVGVALGEQQAFIGAQPHLTRMQMTVSRAFGEAGRPDVGVWATGPALDKDTPVEIVASEVYKTLYEAWLLQRQRASQA